MDRDTSIGGSATRFPQTRHSIVEDVSSADAEVRSAALSDLVSAYWKPVYKYLRLKWRLSNEDAKDLTQHFFAKALEKDCFAGFDPAMASFRTYLRTYLDRFAANEYKAAQRLKRGGSFTALDFEEAERELAFAGGADVEASFDREWVRSLFTLAIDDLRARSEALRFGVFARYELSGDSQVTYAMLADEFGIPVTSVTNYIAAMRRDLRRILLDRLRELTATEREFRSEARQLFGIEA